MSGQCGEVGSVPTNPPETDNDGGSEDSGDGDTDDSSEASLPSDATNGGQ
jgi:hypothetical protein